MSAPAPARPRAARLLIATALAAASVALAAPSFAAAAPPPQAQSPQAQAQAPREQVFALVTPVLKAMARKSATAFFERFESWSEKKVGRAVDAAVSGWIAHHACSAALPRWFFCKPPPKPRWGRGVALQVAGRRPGVFNAPTPFAAAVAGLAPGNVFWLRCWTPGQAVNNGAFRSAYWFALPQGGWVSAAWLYTGPNALNTIDRCRG
jgi:hypothetical protein